MPLVLGPNETGPYHELNEAPAAFLDMLATAGYRAAGVAMRLGLFAALRAGPLSADALADAAGTDPRGTRVLAEVLVSFGYLQGHDDGRYANTPLTDVWLTGEDGYATVERFWNRVLFQMWDHLEEAVRTGSQPVNFYEWLEHQPETLAHFQAMLATHAKLLADEIVDAVPLPADGGSLLDLGGGHARYVVALCAHHPDLRATVLDLPSALAVGAEVVGAEVVGAEVVGSAGLADRITLRPGDYYRDDLGSGYHAVLLFNVLHGHDAATNVTLLRRVADALRPGGAVVILEHGAELPPGAGCDDEAFLRMFSLSLFLGEGGEVYPIDQITGWLADVGLADPTTQRLSASPLQHLVIARKDSAVSTD